MSGLQLLLFVPLLKLSKCPPNFSLMSQFRLLCSLRVCPSLLIKGLYRGMYLMQHYSELSHLNVS